MPERDLSSAARAVLTACEARKLTLATAESCTGGLVAAALTEIAGSSLVVDRGFVTYSNKAKQQMLGVASAVIDTHGAVSRECAEAMARGALTHAPVDLAVSITGIAGPTGATPGKPIGLVFFAAASRGGRLLSRVHKFGDVGRQKIREKSVLEALFMLLELAEKEEPRPLAENGD